MGTTWVVIANWPAAVQLRGAGAPNPARHTDCPPPCRPLAVASPRRHRVGISLAVRRVKRRIMAERTVSNPLDRYHERAMVMGPVLVAFASAYRDHPD
jgi:hypothetical protein